MIIHRRGKTCIHTIYCRLLKHNLLIPPLINHILFRTLTNKHLAHTHSEKFNWGHCLKTNDNNILSPFDSSPHVVVVLELYFDVPFFVWFWWRMCRAFFLHLVRGIFITFIEVYLLLSDCRSIFFLSIMST